jgi:hypothetical protein
MSFHVANQGDDYDPNQQAAYSVPPDESAEAAIVCVLGRDALGKEPQFFFLDVTLAIRTSVETFVRIVPINVPTMRTAWTLMGKINGSRFFHLILQTRTRLSPSRVVNFLGLWGFDKGDTARWKLWAALLLSKATSKESPISIREKGYFSPSLLLRGIGTFLSIAIISPSPFRAVAAREP